MKVIAFFLSWILLASLAFASPVAETARKQAQLCANAQIAKNYEIVMAYTHPALIKAGGGKEALRSALEGAMKQVAAQGVKFEKTIIRSATEPKKVGTALVSLLTQEVTLRIPNGKVTQESTLLGYSYDAGKNWVFADTIEMDEATFENYFPELKGVIALPRKKDPVIVKNSSKPVVPRKT